MSWWKKAIDHTPAGWAYNKFAGGNPANPMDDANQYLNQIPGMEKGYYDPYMKEGQDAYATMSPQMKSMAQDPTGYLQNIMKSYEPSAGYQFKQDQALKATGNSAASGGMRGSINDIQNQAHLTDMLSGDDMQQWLQNVMGIQNQGMAGEQNIYNRGFDATSNLTGDLSNIFGSQAQLAFQNAEDRNKRHSDLLGGLLGLGGGAFGAMAGGPWGAMAGSQMGNSAGKMFG